jgi:2'-5' RNA ligase
VEPHITIKIPFVWRENADAFLEPVRAACASIVPFEAQLEAPARFPGGQVLYLSVQGEGLRPLHLAVASALAGLLPAGSRGHEGEGYQPHLTLASGRYGIPDEGLGRMEEEARAELAGLPPIRVETLRCYLRGGSEDRWDPIADIPLGC